MMLRWPGPERRRSKRALLNTELRVKVVRVPGGAVPPEETQRTARIFNVGEGGLGFMPETEIPVGAEVEVTFRFILGGRRDRAVKAAGRVCYCVLMGDYKNYQVGMEFVRLKEADRQFIADYVKGCAGRAST